MPNTSFPQLIAALKRLGSKPQAVTRLFLDEGIPLWSILVGMNVESFSERFDYYLKEVKNVVKQEDRKEISYKVAQKHGIFLIFLIENMDKDLETYKDYLKHILSDLDLDEDIKRFINHIWIDETIRIAEQSMILPCGDTARELYKLFANTEEVDFGKRVPYAGCSEEITSNKNSQIVYALNKTHAFCLLVLPDEEGEERSCYILQSFIEDEMEMGYSIEEWLLSDKVEKINLSKFLEDVKLLCTIADESNVQEKIEIIERYFYTAALSEEQNERLKIFLMREPFFPEDFTINTSQENVDHIESIISAISPMVEVEPEFASGSRANVPSSPRASQNQYASFAGSESGAVVTKPQKLTGPFARN